jgi:phytoene dehydrogenase-like protein
VHVPFPDGTWLTQWTDLDRTCDELARFSKRDADAYRRLLRDYRTVAPLVTRHRYTPVGFGPSLSELLDGHPQGYLWRRRQAASAWEVIKGTFEDWHVRAFMLWMATQTVQPADRPGTGLLASSIVYGRQRHSWAIPKGGSAALPRALARLITEHGGTFVTGARVTGLVIESGRCTGVETEDGRRYLADKAVLSSIHVKHLLGMAPRATWGEAFWHGVETWQAGVTMFASYHATTEPPRYPVESGTVAPVASGIAPSVERMLRLSHDFQRSHVDTEDPVLLVLCPTTADPSRAPAGHHTLKLVALLPYDLPQGPEHWDTIKEEVAASHLAQLRRYAPNLTEDKILASHVKSPLDLERFNAHNWHGSCHGGDMAPSQSDELRPAHGWAQHRLPIEGLYQTGATTHPGGSVSGGPGRNAATVLLDDLGMRLEHVLAGA